MQLNFLLVSILVFSLLTASCSKPNQTEKDLRESLNKPLHLEMFEVVRQGNTLLSFDELRQKYQYLSVVYLEDGCRSCYPKFIEWQNKIDSINTPIDYTVLFIIGNGNRYDEFMSQVLDLEYMEDKFFTIMDPEFLFLENNKEIPRWIIDSSMLIEPNNKIKMVGPPWINEDMKKLFYETVNNEQ